MSELPISIERQKEETTAQYLNRMREMGFLFHGSTQNQIDILEPKYTQDPFVEENTDTAVFATNNPALTTIFGVNGGNNNWSTDNSENGVIAKIPESERERLEASDGTVYILPKSNFKEAGFQQFKSHEPVTPIKKVRVTIKDYYELNGKIDWTK